MTLVSSGEMYSAREIALASGVPEAQVAALMGGTSRYAPHEDAVVVPWAEGTVLR